jgi:hypothetical protein
MAKIVFFRRRRWAILLVWVMVLDDGHMNLGRVNLGCVDFSLFPSSNQSSAGNTVVRIETSVFTATTRLFAIATPTPRFASYARGWELCIIATISV